VGRIKKRILVNVCEINMFIIGIFAKGKGFNAEKSLSKIKPLQAIVDIKKSQ
jgi:hypothetical protein